MVLPVGIGAAIGLGVLAIVVLALLGLHFTHCPRSYNLHGKLVIITGGSLGIGKATAQEALKRGASVILVARTASQLKEAVKELEPLAKAPGQKVLWAAVDLKLGYKQVEAALTPVIEESGQPVDVLINCAGTSVAASFDSLPLEEFEHMMRVNYLGSVYPTRLVVPGMKKRRSGAIVFVSSQAGQVGLWGYTSYSASKFAVRGLAQALAMELHPYNIYVSVAYPPDTDTPGFKIENEAKPRETAEICAGGSVFPAHEVARSIIRGIESRQFSVFTGLDGFMLANLTCGMEPVFSVLQGMAQVLTCSLFRLVSLFYVMSFYQISHTCAAEKEKQAAQSQKGD